MLNMYSNPCLPPLVLFAFILSLNWGAPKFLEFLVVYHDTKLSNPTKIQRETSCHGTKLGNPTKIQREPPCHDTKLGNPTKIQREPHQTKIVSVPLLWQFVFIKIYPYNSLISLNSLSYKLRQ